MFWNLHCTCIRKIKSYLLLLLSSFFIKIPDIEIWADPNYKIISWSFYIHLIWSNYVFKNVYTSSKIDTCLIFQKYCNQKSTYQKYLQFSTIMTNEILKLTFVLIDCFELPSPVEDSTIHEKKIQLKYELQLQCW